MRHRDAKIKTTSIYTDAYCMTFHEAKIQKHIG